MSGYIETGQSGQFGCFSSGQINSSAALTIISMTGPILTSHRTQGSSLLSPMIYKNEFHVSFPVPPPSSTSSPESQFLPTTCISSHNKQLRISQEETSSQMCRVYTHHTNLWLSYLRRGKKGKATTAWSTAGRATAFCADISAPPKRRR